MKHDPGDRGVLGAVIQLCRAPEHVARLFVEGSNRSLIAAGCADDFVAVDKDRLAEAPRRLLATQLGHRSAPDFAAIFRTKATDLALAAHGVDEVALDGRSAARSVAPVVCKLGAHRRRPKLLARAFVE